MKREKLKNEFKKIIILVTDCIQNKLEFTHTYTYILVILKAATRPSGQNSQCYIAYSVLYNLYDSIL